MQPREPVIPAARRTMSKSRRAAVYARDGERCAEPGCEERGSEIDHVLPLDLGGADALDNLQALCQRHHAEKTVFDRRRSDKARRIRKREAGEQRATRTIPSRPLTHPTLRRTMAGRVERRTV